VAALLDNRDPDRVPALIANLPEAVRSDLAALDLSRRDLAQLDARLLLVHGRDDPIIPSTESEALAAAAPDDTALYVVDSLAHVELGPAGLVDGWKLWRAVYRLLALRDAGPKPQREACP
jgi:pimeloyl-ACP methyl ester carboxylesterase